MYLFGTRRIGTTGKCGSPSASSVFSEVPNLGNGQKRVRKVKIEADFVKMFPEENLIETNISISLVHYLPNRSNPTGILERLID